MKRFFTFISLIIIAFNTVSALQLDSYEEKSYRDEVKTVLLHPTASDIAKPIVKIDEIISSLYLQFDIIGTEAPYLYFTFIHCTHDWKPSELREIEYIDGFTSSEIPEYTFSRNTLIDYVHYDFIFPTEDMVPKLSGNYLLVVYADNDPSPENIYFTKRFMVLENMSSISMEIPRYPYDLNFGTNVHQVKIEATYPEMFNSRASEYSNLTIQQNGRIDNIIEGLKPTFVYPDKMTYENSPATVFMPGNQYRHFNTSNLRNRPEKTKTVIRGNENIIVTLEDDYKLNLHAYVDEEDLLGEKYIFLERKEYDIRFEGDYVTVRFFLKWAPEMADKDVYILGAINDWRLDDYSLMTYDPQRKGYECEMLLKQGVYDYTFAVTDKDGHKGELGTVNGDYWETVCQYTAMLYFYNVNMGYDMLIGVATASSH